MRDALFSKRLHARIGFVFQDSDAQLFCPSVADEISFGPRQMGLSADEVERRVDDTLELLGIQALRSRAPWTLSGGEKKLVSIATILSMTPDIILMDEPSVALDPQNRRNLIHIIREFEHLKMIASHDLDFIWDTCERTILMNDGRIVWDGPTEEIKRDEKLLTENGLELPLSLSRR